MGFGFGVAAAIGEGVAVIIGVAVARADAVALAEVADPGVSAREPHATANAVRTTMSTRAFMLRGYRAKRGCFMTNSSYIHQHCRGGYDKYFLNHSTVAAHAFCACTGSYRAPPVSLWKAWFTPGYTVI